MAQYLEHIEHLWEWLVEKTTIALGPLLGFDPVAVLPWAQLLAAVLAIALSSWGILNLWRRADAQRRKLLRDFLDAEEKRVHERKAEVALRFLKPRESTEELEVLNVDAELDTALRLHEKGKLKKADQTLSRLLDAIQERRVIAGRQAEVAALQVGAIHLFKGAMLASQGQATQAIEQFKSACSANPDDVDAQRYIVEQYLILAEVDPPLRVAHFREADRHLSILEGIVGSSQERSAVAKMLRGRWFEMQGNLGNAYASLGDAVAAAEKAGSDILIAQAQERLGVVAEHPNRDFWRVALNAYQASAAAYRRIGRREDEERVQALHDKLELRKLGPAAQTGTEVPVVMPSPKGPKQL